MTAPELEVPLPTAPPFAGSLARFGDRPALVGDGATLTYTELAARVDALVAELGPVRRLVMVECSSSVGALIGYLAGLAGGHVVLLTAADQAHHLDALTEVYDPDVVLSADALDCRLDARREGTRHALHPDLALLLSTSGTTGSPKLVRLSHTNLQANAESIASSLDLDSDDRAVTTLPMHYSYGLSVINSHLLCGARIVLTDLSVVDPCFWDLVRSQRVTSFAGVPYTFELLDRIGFAELDLPHLRAITQAGGRLAPDRVAAYAELGQRRGWDFYVMYGQTEATARIACLPPDLAAESPGAIGVPVPGGTIRLDTSGSSDTDTDGRSDVGELVYAGPNVMLGYAESPSDLGRGRTVDELHTGDLARRLPNGLFEIVGRRSRIAKVLGLRIDLDRVESTLDEQGVVAVCLAQDDRLAVVVEGEGALSRVEGVARREFGLPPAALHVTSVEAIPRGSAGKPDHRALTEHVRSSSDAGEVTEGVDAAAPPVTNVEELRDAFATALRRPDATVDDTFTTLGGDSLSYVEMSLVVEQALGHLPPGWHVTPIRELAPSARPARRGWRSIEMSVALRASAILMILSTHIDLFRLQGGAHVLLAIAGYNVARFQLTSAPRIARLRNITGGLTRIAAPSVLWIACMLVATDIYRWPNLLLLNGVLGPRGPEFSGVWHYWFIEVLVYFLVVVMALVAVPCFDRSERRFPFAVPVSLMLLGLVTRYEIVEFAAGPPVLAAHVVFWMFCLGWAAARADSTAKRAFLSVVAVATLPGFFERPVRDVTVIAGVLLLVWVRNVRVPTVVAKACAVLASASLCIYLTHWHVYPTAAKISPAFALAACVAVGIAYWLAFTRVWAAVATRRHLSGRFRRPGPRRRNGSGQGPRSPDAAKGVPATATRERTRAS